MKEKRGDVWDQVGLVDAILITTNGFVTASGGAVMGMGIAKEAAKRYPGIKQRLGSLIRAKGNYPHMLHEDSGTEIWSFPVKPDCIERAHPDSVVAHMKKQIPPMSRAPGWACVAKPSIIKSSATEMSDVADARGWTSVAMPRPGCGAGELEWIDIGPILHRVLDDRFVSYTFGGPC